MVERIIDADRKRIRLNEPVLVVDLPDFVLNTQVNLNGLQKMDVVVVGMKTDQIGPQQACEQVFLAFLG